MNNQQVAEAKRLLTGPWAGLVVAWDEQDQFDEATYREDVARCCRAGVPGVYTAGTSGEFYAMSFDEFTRVARATVEVCRAHTTPVMIGCTSTCTRGAVQRAALAAELGADAIQVALPFWMEVPDEQVVPFFREVAGAAPGLALSIYETMRAKKTLTLGQHRAIHEAVPGYVMVKANANTLGATADGCRALSRFVNVFANETSWATLGPAGLVGSCSAMVYWNPRVVLRLWRLLQEERWPDLDAAMTPVIALHDFLAKTYAPHGFTDTAYDRMAAVATGFLRTSLRCRAPYPGPTPQDVETLRAWCAQHFPEMLELEA